MANIKMYGSRGNSKQKNGLTGTIIGVIIKISKSLDTAIGVVTDNWYDCRGRDIFSKL